VGDVGNAGKDIDINADRDNEELILCDGNPCPREDEDEDVGDVKFTIDLEERESGLDLVYLHKM